MRRLICFAFILLLVLTAVAGNPTQAQQPSTPTAPVDPLLTPTIRPTIDPNTPIYKLGRFEVPDVRAIFGGEAPAVIGSFRFYDNGTVDIVPKRLEKCVDTSLAKDLTCFAEKDSQPIGVYAPVNGCAFRLVENSSTVVFVVNCENDVQFKGSDGKAFRGRREILLAHLDPETTKSISTSGKGYKAGQYIASLCTLENKKACDIGANLPPYLSFQPRFRTRDGIIPALPDETIALLATPDCVFDEFAYAPGQAASNTTPIKGCPEPK